MDTASIMWKLCIVGHDGSAFLCEGFVWKVIKDTAFLCEGFVWKAIMDVARSKFVVCVGQRGRRSRSTRVRNGIVCFAFRKKRLRGYRVNPLDLAGILFNASGQKQLCI